MQVPLVVEPHHYARGIEAEPAQPFEIVLRDEAAVAHHVGELVVAERQTRQIVEGRAQTRDELIVVFGQVAVAELKGAFGLRKCLEVWRTTW